MSEISKMLEEISASRNIISKITDETDTILGVSGERQGNANFVKYIFI